MLAELSARSEVSNLSDPRPFREQAYVGGKWTAARAFGPWRRLLPQERATYLRRRFRASSSASVWGALEQGAERLGAIGHGWTYSAHPTCAAAGLANLDIIEREDLLGNVREVGPYLLASRREAVAYHPLVGEVRRVGLLAAVEFVADKAERRFVAPERQVGAAVAAACLECGMITRAMPHGDILGFGRALTLRKPGADRIVATTKAAIEAVAAALRPF